MLSDPARWCRTKPPAQFRLPKTTRTPSAAAILHTLLISTGYNIL